MIPAASIKPTRVYWTAFIGLFFDYYDLYLFIYLDKVLASEFGLSAARSNALQFAGLAAVGLGALLFGYRADRRGRGRTMLAVFVVYGIGILGLSLARGFGSALACRVLASLALGAEWGISHTFMNEHVPPQRRYRFAALLQFAILGGLLSALAARYALPVVGWRILFAASIVPVAALSLWRRRWLLASESAGRIYPGCGSRVRLTMAEFKAFARCLALASLTIASGTVNVFFAKELPQSPLYTVLFWGAVAPGMLLGAWVVRRAGVRRAILGYACALVLLSAFAWSSGWAGRKLAFALALPLLNGIPFGLMGAYFNAVFARFRTMLSGSAYNFGRILAGFAPLLMTALGLSTGGNYFLFSAGLGLAVFAIGWGMPDCSADTTDPE